MDSKHSSSVIFSVTLFSHFNLTGPQSPYLQNKVTLNLHKISLCSREIPWQSIVYDCTSNAGGTGSIHGQGPQIPGTTWHSQKKKIVSKQKWNLRPLGKERNSSGLTGLSGVPKIGLLPWTQNYPFKIKRFNCEMKKIKTIQKNYKIIVL